MIRARLTAHYEEPTVGWSPERIAAIKFATHGPRMFDADFPSPGALFAIHKKGLIVEGELAEKAIAAGKAVLIPEEPVE